MRELFLRAFRGQFLIELLVRGRGLLILPIATRELGPEGYGLVAFAAAVTGLTGTLATLGMPAALARFLPARTAVAERAEILWPAFIACTASVLTMAAIAAAAFGALPIEPSGIPYALILVALANMATTELKLVLINFFRQTLQLRPYYRFLMADVVLSGVVQAVVLVVLHGDAIALIGSIVVADAVILMALLAVLARRLPWHRATRATLTPLYRFGLPLIADPLLNWANNMADRFFIQVYVGTAALGIYSVGYNLGFTVVSIVATPIFAVLPTLLFRAWDANDRDDARRLLAQFSSILPLVCLPGMLSLTFFGEPVIVLLAGEAFRGAHEFVFWISLGYLLMWIGDMYGYMLMANARQYLYSASLIGAVAVNLALNAILVPDLGAIGAAYATAGSLLTLAVFLYALTVRAGYARPPIRGPAAICAVAGACWVAADQLWPATASVVDAVVFSIATSAVFIAATYALRLVPELRSVLRGARPAKA